MIARELHPPALSVDAPGGEPFAADGGRRDTEGTATSPVQVGAEVGDGVEGSAPADRSTTGRLRAIIEDRYDFVWRTVVHFGVPEASAEDAAQKVMCVLARRIDDVAPGAEMAFLFSTAVRVASEARRSARRRPEDALEDVDALVAEAPSPEDLVEERRARELLTKVLQAIPEDLRQVFVLFELEELTIAQVAAVVGVPAGTAASRLRRARSIFRDVVRRLRAAQNHRVRGGRL